MNQFSIQIDVKYMSETSVLCNLYTGTRCVQITMGKGDYHHLIRDGFFIRDGKQKDSADILNTTNVFIPQIEK